MINDTGENGIELRPEGNKPARAERGSGRRRREVKRPGDAIAQVAAGASQEIKAFEQEIQLGVDAWTDHQAEQILAGVADAPNQVVEKLIAKAGEYSADADTFRERGREFAKAFFSVG